MVCAISKQIPLITHFGDRWHPVGEWGLDRMSGSFLVDKNVTDESCRK